PPQPTLFPYTTLFRSEAADAFRKALEQNPQFPRAHYDLGLALYSLGNVPEAAVEFKSAINLRGGSYPDAHYELGRIYAAEQKYRSEEHTSELQSQSNI